MYQALYRKWRPKTFDEVIGQEHITETLKTQVQTGHLSHAYIFIGTRGTGKTTCARILAKAVNCENPVNGNPCNRCRFCRGIDDGSILDIVELDAASNTGVDNVRELREEAIFSPASARKRVYIIDEVHMLSLAAFNALLKIIEEPPPHLMFILATTELQKVPATILSRCQRHSFRRIPTEKLAEYLMEIAGREGLELEHQAALQIGRLAEGGVRDALSILDQCSGRGSISVETVFETMGLAGNRNLTELLRDILKHDAAASLRLFQKIWLEGKEPVAFLGELSGLVRDILIVKAAPGGADELISGNYERAELDALAAEMTKEEILFCADTLQDSIARIRQVRSPRTVAELCLVSLADNRTAESMLSLRARISRLEEAAAAGMPIAVPKGEPAPAADGREQEAPTASERPEPMEEKAPEPTRPEVPPEKRETAESETPKTAQTGTAEMKREEDAAAQEQRILDAAKQRLPRDIRGSLGQAGVFQLRLQGQTLTAEASPGFWMERIRRGEVRDILAEIGQEVLGVPVTVRYAEIGPAKGGQTQRSLGELKQFSEIRFV